MPLPLLLLDPNQQCGAIAVLLLTGLGPEAGLVLNVCCAVLLCCLHCIVL